MLLAVVELPHTAADPAAVFIMNPAKIQHFYIGIFGTAVVARHSRSCFVGVHRHKRMAVFGVVRTLLHSRLVDIRWNLYQTFGTVVS